MHEGERKKMNKIEVFVFGFLTLLKVSETYQADLAIEWLRDAVCKLFALFCFVFLGASPIQLFTRLCFGFSKLYYESH